MIALNHDSFISQSMYENKSYKLQFLNKLGQRRAEKASTLNTQHCVVVCGKKGSTSSYVCDLILWQLMSMLKIVVYAKHI